MPPRARALPPEQRRAAILDAVVPVVLDKGMAATTKELACAAGVAEGTLFRVFESKDELVLAAARGVFARQDHLEQLAAVDATLPLQARLVEVVGILARVMARIHRVLVTFESDNDTLGNPRTLVGPTVVRRSEALIAQVLEPDAHQLRLPVPEVVRILHSLTMAGVHPAGLGGPLQPPQIVDILLHGVLDTAPGRTHHATHSTHIATPGTTHGTTHGATGPPPPNSG